MKRTYKSKEQTFKEEFIPWCKTNGRLPSASSSDPIEKKLGTWRNRNKEWDILIEFMSHYEKKRKSKEQTFKEDFIPWCKTNGCLPSEYSSDLLERRLGRWRSNNRGWKLLIQFSVLVKYSKTNQKAHELLEKFMEH